MSKRVVVLMQTNIAYTRGVLRSIARYGHVHGGWEFLLSDPGFDRMPDFGAMDVQGIITMFIDLPFVRKVLRMGLPTVNVSARLEPNPEWHCVIPDNYAIGRLVGEEFLKRGFRNFAFWGYPRHWYTLERARGFSETVAKSGFTCHIGHWSDDESLRQGLEKLPRPLVVMGANDNIGRHVLEQCQKLRFRVPVDVAVVGVDDDDIFCEYCEPPLSSVKLDLEQIGQQAMAMLARHIRSRKEPPQTVLVPPVGIAHRQSSDVFAVQDKAVSEALRFIRDNAHRPLDVSEVASSVAIGRRSLEVRFRQSLGTTPAKEIRQAHMDAARRLLAETDYPMSQVAAESGFTSMIRLSEAFARDLKTTPGNYRRKYRVRD